jgi:hypothetical protein
VQKNKINFVHIANVFEVSETFLGSFLLLFMLVFICSAVAQVLIDNEHRWCVLSDLMFSADVVT